MLINKLRIFNFRNFKDKIFQFSEGITVVVGPNASGKTNLLESLYLLSTGKSFKARLEEEMISYENDLARVTGQISSREHVASLPAGKAGSMQRTDNHSTYYKLQTTKLEVILTRGEIEIRPGEKGKVARKKLLVNGIPKRLVDFTGNFKTVLFGPWDLDLVTESPSLRRKFMDTVLSQVDRDYRRAILSYEKGLRQRNKLLLRIREENIPRSQLLFWDKLLIKNGDLISDRRAELIEYINASGKLPTINYHLEYDKSAISETRLEEYAEEEVAAATTLVGPHRDDFMFFLKKNKEQTCLPAGRATNNKDKRDLARYGSRGEQRMGVLWLKLAELAFVEEKTGEKPTLLLDDIFSELDHEHRDIVMDISKKQQTIITTADPHYIEPLSFGSKIEL